MKPKFSTRFGECTGKLETDSMGCVRLQSPHRECPSAREGVAHLFVCDCECHDPIGLAARIQGEKKARAK